MQSPQRRQRRRRQQQQRRQRRQDYPGSLSLPPRSRKKRHAARTGSIQSGTLLTRGAGRMLITGAGAATATNDQVLAGEHAPPIRRRLTRSLWRSGRSSRFPQHIGVRSMAALRTSCWCSDALGAVRRGQKTGHQNRQRNEPDGKLNPWGQFPLEAVVPFRDFRQQAMPPWPRRHCAEPHAYGLAKCCR